MEKYGILPESEMRQSGKLMTTHMIKYQNNYLKISITIFILEPSFLSRQLQKLSFSYIANCSWHHYSKVSSINYVSV